MKRKDARSVAFGLKLRSDMNRQNITVRALSRRISNGDHHDQEQARRNIYKWLAGDHLPSEGNREAVAVALGLPRDAYTNSNEEDEEEAALAIQLFNLVQEIVDRRREVNRDEVPA